MKTERRRFLEGTAAVAGAAIAGVFEEAIAEVKPVRTATDLVPLGKNGPKICRLGMGTGSESGAVQMELGRQGFNQLVRHAYDQGVTYIDTADMYRTHEWIRDAIKGLPREKLWIQTKMRWDAPSPPEKPLEVLDRFRKELGVDYIDSLLIHCCTKPTWDEDLRRMRDAFSEAKEKKIIKLHGVSCHGLPALQRATHVDWADVQLARVNPQGRHVDGLKGEWEEPGIVPDAMKEIKAIHAKGRGVIGMKMIGNGDFKKAEDREKAIQFAMKCGFVDAVVVGFKSALEIDETIERMNRALI